VAGAQGGRMTKIEIWTELDDNHIAVCDKHPQLFQYFCEYMKDVRYGGEEIRDAMTHFCAGWLARDMQVWTDLGRERAAQGVKRMGGDE